MTAELVTVGQVVVLVEARIGGKVTAGQVRRALTSLAKDGWVEAGLDEEGRWAAGPADVDRLAGELWLRRAGWSRRANVTEGYPAVVEVEGRRLVLRMPYKRTWDRVAAEETKEVAQEVECYEWPTGRVTGKLVRDGEVDGLPLYVAREARSG